GIMISEIPCPAVLTDKSGCKLIDKTLPSPASPSALISNISAPQTPVSSILSQPSTRPSSISSESPSTDPSNPWKLIVGITVPVLCILLALFIYWRLRRRRKPTSEDLLTSKSSPPTAPRYEKPELQGNTVSELAAAALPELNPGNIHEAFAGTDESDSGFSWNQVATNQEVDTQIRKSSRAIGDHLTAYGLKIHDPAMENYQEFRQHFLDILIKARDIPMKENEAKKIANNLNYYGRGTEKTFMTKAWLPTVGEDRKPMPRNFGTPPTGSSPTTLASSSTSSPHSEAAQRLQKLDRVDYVHGFTLVPDAGPDKETAIFTITASPACVVIWLNWVEFGDKLDGDGQRPCIYHMNKLKSFFGMRGTR
ncbi:MAG: hypothetical protein Q9199_000663, partial [Rusavskia elegans]